MSEKQLSYRGSPYARYSESKYELLIFIFYLTIKLRLNLAAKAPTHIHVCKHTLCVYIQSC